MRRARLETIENSDGSFHIRLRASNGRILAHTETLQGRQIKRARVALLGAMADILGADEVPLTSPVTVPKCVCPTCELVRAEMKP